MLGMGHVLRGPGLLQVNNLLLPPSYQGEKQALGLEETRGVWVQGLWKWSITARAPRVPGTALDKGEVVVQANVCRACWRVDSISPPPRKSWGDRGLLLQ